MKNEMISFKEEASGFIHLIIADYKENCPDSYVDRQFYFHGIAIKFLNGNNYNVCNLGVKETDFLESNNLYLVVYKFKRIRE